MSSYRITLAQAIETAVNSDVASYIRTDLEVQRAWVPVRKRKDFESSPPKLWIINAALDTQPSQSRNSLSRAEIVIQTGLQKAIESHQTVTEIDELVELDEQILDTIRKLDPDGYSWIRTESLKDENGLPFDITKIRDENTFEVYYLHYFNYVLQP